MRFCSWGRLLGSLLPWRPDMAAGTGTGSAAHEGSAGRRHLSPPSTAAAEGQTCAGGALRQSAPWRQSGQRGTAAPGRPRFPGAGGWDSLAGLNAERGSARSAAAPRSLPDTEPQHLGLAAPAERWLSSPPSYLGKIRFSVHLKWSLHKRSFEWSALERDSQREKRVNSYLVFFRFSF